MQDERPAVEQAGPSDPQLGSLVQALREGRHSRRDLARYGLALGLSGATLSAFLAACGDDDDGGGSGGGGGGEGGQGQLIDAAPDGADLAKPEPFKYASEEMTIDDALAFKVPKAKDNYKIAYMLISLQGYYFVAAAYGADEAGKAAGVDIQRIAAEGYASPDVQQQQLGDLLQKNVDAVVVLPADVNGSVALVDQAQGAGVVMTVAGSLLNSNKVAQAVQSDYALGQQSADLVAERLNGSGGVGLIMGGPKQATWAVHRVAGFNARIQEKYPEMEVGVTTHQNFVDPTEGLNTFQDAIQRQPDLHWIYAVDYNLLEAPSLPSKYRGKTPYVGMGLYGSSKAALQDGTLAAVLGIMPVLGAKLGVSRAVQILNGEDVPAITVYPAPVYTKDNLNAPETRFDTYPEDYKV
jgi:ABC-type sugar transport system substrate-binding protein